MNDSLLHDLCLRYLDGDLNQEEARSFGRLIAESEEAAQHLARYAIHDRLFQAALRSHRNKNSDQSRMNRLLNELRRMEEDAPLNLVALDKAVVRTKKSNQRSSPSLKQAIGLTGWALMHSVRSKPAPWLSAAAAVLLIAVVVVWQSMGPSPTQQSPGTPESPGPLAGQEEKPDHVATLTAAYGAKWEGDAIRAGAALYPGDRLTLTDGVVEITTGRGAAAIIEAPATIELLDNNNAIELHSGKLVGICETESSKGFLVRTPHMEITDLGTRFGVNNRANATEVHVFEGLVQVNRPDAQIATKPITLAAHQSARAPSDTRLITRIDHETKSFAAMLPTTIQLPGTGTGKGLVRRDIDPDWRVVAVDGLPLDTPLALAVNGGEHYVRSHPNDPATSQWLSFKPAEQTGDEHSYRVRTTLELPESLSSKRARINLSYMADNAMRAVIVNGQRIELPKSEWRDGFTPFQHAVIDRHLVPGPNTIEFELVNISKDGKLSIAGLRIAWELSTDSAFTHSTNPKP